MILCKGAGKSEQPKGKVPRTLEGFKDILTSIPSSNWECCFWRPFWVVQVRRQDQSLSLIPKIPPNHLSPCAATTISQLYEDEFRPVQYTESKAGHSFAIAPLVVVLQANFENFAHPFFP